jgi:hypothetical protein
VLLGRILGWLLIALALLALGGDALGWLQSGLVTFATLGDFWRRLDTGSLELLQRWTPPAVWDPALVTLLGWPATAVLGAAGILLLILFRRREPKRRQRFGALS